MPALPDADHCIRVKYSGTFLSAFWVNIFYVKFAGTTPSSSDLNGFCTAARNSWTSAIAPLIGASSQLKTTEAWDLTTRTSAYGIDSTSVAGNRTGTVYLAANNAAVLSFKVANRYRGGHPRMYLCGLQQDTIVSGNQYLGAYLTLLKTNAANFLTAINAITLTGGAVQMIGLSFYNKALNPTYPHLRTNPLPMTIVGTGVRSRPDSQRRRLGKEIS